MTKKEGLQKRLTDLNIEFDEFTTISDLEKMLEDVEGKDDVESKDKKCTPPVAETNTKEVAKIVKNLENTTQKGTYLTVNVTIGNTTIPKNTVLDDLTIKTLIKHGCEKYLVNAKV